jgi:hypothetical protein
MSTLHDLARALYDGCPTVKPTWDQLGDVTKSVWIERAQSSAPRPQSILTQPPNDSAPAGEQIGLF